MTSLTNRRVGLLLVVWLLALAVAGCAPNANAELISPQLGEQLYAKEANEEVEIAPTPEPRKIANMAPEEVTAGLPDDFAAALAAADPSRGQAVALSNACIGCHSLDPNQVMTGPTWFHVADVAANRRPDMSPAFYIYHSIIAPNEHVVEGYPANVMPQIYAETISQGDLANLVAYLLQQHE
jgi:mono/diheme cytochrome c family protein